MTALLDDSSLGPIRRADGTGICASVACCVVHDGRLVVTGAVDESSRAAIRAGFAEALHDRDVATVDMTGVTFFGAAGIGILEEFALQDRCTVLGTARIRWILDIVGCPHLLTEVSQAA